MKRKEKTRPLSKILEKLFRSKQPIEDVSGVYLGEDRFLRVVAQPSGRPEYVSEITGVATNFQLAARYGNIGLIAHNYLGGKYFGDLKVGDRLYVFNGRRQRQRYRVSQILRYQALTPRSPRSDFIDLDTRRLHSVSDVFRRIYTGQHHLVLQTCIERGTIKEWGRLFIIAEPDFI